MNERMIEMVFQEVLAHKFRDKGSPVARLRSLNLDRDKATITQTAREVVEMTEFLCEEINRLTDSSKPEEEMADALKEQATGPGKQAELDLDKPAKEKNEKATVKT